jgi:hypothetical protein
MLNKKWAYETTMLSVPLCAYLFSHVNFRTLEPNFMKLDMYINLPDYISIAYFINLLPQSVRLYA